MNRTAITTFAARAAKQRSGMFGVPVVYLGQDLVGSAASFKSTRQLRETGFLTAHDAILRVDRNAYPGFAPEMGKRIIVDGQEFRIEEVTSHPINPEWRLGLDNP